jgi:ribonucleoside-diphosphate reductase alpha chain
VLVTAQEILVDRARYPTERIGERSWRFRPLGLGFANLGGLLMSCGLPYDSDAGRALGAGVAALMAGAAYRQSARLAALRGPFAAWEDNAEPMTAVVAAHAAAAAAIDGDLLPEPLRAEVLAVWDEARRLGKTHGFRNAQATCLAPTGTIALLMDCDTTGVEPELALVKHKQLVGGGSLRIVNRSLPQALRSLGYDETEAGALLQWVEQRGTLEGAPELDPQHLPVFDCALPAQAGGRQIAPRGHLRMLAALQPLISGGISKTINLPHEATVEAIEEVLLDGWRLGLKAVSVYRDGCKGSQPMTSGPATERVTAREGATALAATAAGEGEGGTAGGPLVGASGSTLAVRPPRRRLPDERRSLTHKFSIQGHEGYVTAGLYEDGQPGEIFLVMAKEGSTISGLMDALATAVSIALQYGVPLRALVEKFSHTRFEPSGMTRNPAIPYAKSITDYLFRWLGAKFLPASEHAALGIVERGGTNAPAAGHGEPAPSSAASDAGGGAALALHQQDAPPCHVCGALMTRSGTCYRCDSCGATSGCG